MGISGLLPLLKSIHRPSNLKQFAGQTIGVDAYGWLHRGTVACAIELALGQQTTKFVDFALHRVRMLIHFGVTPYLVFDGDYLPSKAATEEQRARSREESKRLGLELYKLGKKSQAHQELQKAVDVSPEMARQLIEELKAMGVDYIVAPYEADSQLAYLERKGIIDGILSEDSDLLVFGAKHLLTKLDRYGNCVEIRRNDFTACREINLAGWTDTEFRRMAILSGCDYLTSMNGLGLKTAYRLVRKHKTVEKVLHSVQFDGQHRVPSGYLEAFRQAELTFLHQRVFCPHAKCLVMYTEPSEEIDTDEMQFIGKYVEPEVAMGVARGDLHPMTKEPLIVQPRSLSTPRVSVNRHSTRPGLVDLKGNKPIDSFFENKRTPLAELDPNSFTPSPSQQRLLQRPNASWSASPATSRVVNPATALHRRGPTVPASAPAAPQRGVHSTRGAVASIPQKRARLLSDADEKSSTATKGEIGRSRFFSSSAPEPSPSIRKSSGHNTTKGSNANLWSDDSVDDIMANLPDVSDSLVSSKKPKVPIFQGQSIACKSRPQKPTDNRSIAKPGRNYDDTPIHASKSHGKDTSPFSVGSGSSVFDHHVSAELQALRDKFSYTPLAKGSKSCLTKQSEIMTNQETKTRKDYKVQRASSGPSTSDVLEPVSPEQLKTTASRGRDMQASGLPDLPSKGELEQRNDLNSVSTDAVEVVLASDGLEPPDPILSEMKGKGSEDLIVSDSEYESDGELGTPVKVKPSLDLGKFAFVPR
ncbi:MAG: hypothetical protein M1819_000870 [Sarea resinae]|nr:MAG: hypothetical protein M1819_000870 [Sarea resinae]